MIASLDRPDADAGLESEPMEPAEGHELRAAEFFAGIGLVGLALERAGLSVAWANDIEPVKAKVYEENLDGSRFRLGDIRDVSGRSIPLVDLATASFPCTDLSLAGNRKGLGGEQSGMFWGSPDPGVGHVGGTGVRSCGSWRLMGPAPSMTRASAASAEWKP